MESPVRICLGAALVVNLLLLCGTDGGAIPETTTINIIDKDDRVKLNKTNTWTGRNPPKTPDVSLNELNPKESTSEEHTEKNAKYKDRGRVRYITNSDKPTPKTPYRRNRSTTSTSTTSTEAATLIIVTPTPEVKKPLEIIDGMRTYKSKISSTTPLSVKKEVKSVEEYEDREDEEENDSFEKYTSSKYFTIPNFETEDFDHDSDNESSDNKVKQDYYSSPSHSFSSYFPKEYIYKDDSEPFKSSFFDFDSELTTPKNDFFDKKYQEISSSIIKNLDSIKAKSPPPNKTNVHKIVQENIGLERLSNNTPSNKSSVFLKNTKEIRLSDNQGAGSANKELSDVQGTSIYYEMSVLSTETYAINHSDDDDCDDSPSVEATASTSSLEELSSIKAQPPKDATKLETKSETLSTVPTNFLKVPSIHPIFDSDVVSFSTPYPSTTERVTRLFSSSFSRNRNYSKRLNLNGTKDSPNSVTIKSYSISSTAKPLTRKFHHTTPKNKPVWMAPRRNLTRGYPKPTSPTTIYAEHFDVRNKYTPAIRKPSKTMLTTVPSAEIDPVLQSDIAGTKKVVHSQSISDNTIPSLRKRGSTRFTTSTASSTEKETELADLELPSTAWALAGLISPPSLPTGVVNATENELQKVGEVIDKKETTIGTTTTTTASPINNNIITKKVTDVDQNKLLWQPAYSPTSPTVEATSESKLEKKLEQSNSETISERTTEATLDNAVDSKPKEVKPLWIPATDIYTTSPKEIPPVDATKSTGFESITKLPADVTTPQQDEVVASSNVNQTVTVEKPKATTENYDITTIRFSYLPTEATEPTDDDVTTWHPSMPTRTKQTTIDTPITTYRPKYMTTTDVEETTTTIPDTTPVLEVSSQVITNATDKLTETTETTLTTEQMTTQPTETTETPTQPPTTTPVTTRTTSTTMTTPTTTEQTTQTTELPEDTTTIVVEVVTEINTEKVTIVTPPPITTSTEILSTEIIDVTSEENSNSNEVDPEIKTTSEATLQSETTTEKLSTTPTMTTKTTQTTGFETTKATPTIGHETIKPTTETTKATQTTEPASTEATTEPSEKLIETTTEEDGTKMTNDLEDVTTYAGEMTTEASSRVLPDEGGSGAAIAIAVSTIGVIALILLIGLLLIVRRRGRRGVYAQRCTPVSLDAYSLDSVSVGHRKGNQRLRASKRSYGNPAYDDEVTSHPMQYPALANFALDVESITAEFAEIPSVTVRPEEVPAGCEDKNRYSNVLPLPETRVPLRRIGNDPTSEYINANYVSGPGNIRNYYILAQAPLSNTVIDFWRMVWEQNSRLIVMLTEYMENGVEKCYEYLPPSEITDNKRTFGEYKIVLKKREQRDKYSISTVQMYNLTTRTWREITHLWYFWPAKGVPDDYDSVIDFLFEMRSYMKVAQTAKEFDEEGVEVIYGDQNRSSFNNLSKLREDNSSGNGVNVYSPARAEEQMRRGYANNGTLSRMKAASEVEGIRPCVLTCASGAGRSAALAALDICSRALLAGGADVPRATRLLRTQRPHSLANRHHYTFLYKVLSEYGNKVMGGGDTI